MAFASALQRLEQPVSAVMTEGFITLPVDAALRTAAQAMRDRHIGLVLVTEGDELVGVISERDLTTAVADGDDCEQISLADRARGAIITIPATATIAAAIGSMADKGIRHLVVVDPEAGQPTGVLSARDVLAELARL